MQENPLKVLTRSLVALPLLAIALGVGAPMYGGTVSFAGVDGSLGTNAALIYDTTEQIGSPVSTTLTWSASCTTCVGYTVSGSGDARVINGSLGARATVTATGTLPVPFSALADSYSEYGEGLTINGGTPGTSGVLALQYAVDGSQGPTGGDIAFFSDFFAADYQVGSGPITSGTEADFFGATTSTTVTFYLTFTYGTAFYSEIHLEAGPLFGSGASAPSSETVDFYNTASLNSALVYDGTVSNLGAQNTSAVITSDSGLNYGPNGISAVPEPGTWLLVASAIGVLALAKRRRAFRPTL
jgi:hypothetical protein